MATESMYDKIPTLLKNADSIALFIHINPDGDCICSALAAYTFLKKAGKTPYLFYPEGYTFPDKFKFLKNYDKFDIAEAEQYDIGLALDCGDAGRLSTNNYRVFMKKCKTTVCIDHHETHANFAQNLLIEGEAAATAQILYKVLSAYNEKLFDSDIAAQLFTALVADSGRFSYSSVSPETFIVASKVLAYGFDVADLVRRVEKNVKLNVFNLTNRVLAKAKFFENNTIGVVTFSMEDFLATGCDESNTEGIINNILNVDSVEIAIAISEIKDKNFKVSFRSKSVVNVGVLAKCFGGGGHCRASGCRIYGYYEDIFNKLLDAAKEQLSYV